MTAEERLVRLACETASQALSLAAKGEYEEALAVIEAAVVLTNATAIDFSCIRDQLNSLERKQRYGW